MDKGPWTVHHDRLNGRAIGVGSDDFKLDVLLRVSGDFGCNEERDAYCAWLAGVLNAALAGDAKPDTRPCGCRGQTVCDVCQGVAVPASASPNIAESNDRADAAPKCRLPTFKDCGVCMEYPFCGCGAQAWTDRIRVALLPYVRHTHPNCHDVKAPGSTERHGCLCGLADALAMPLVQPPAAPATEAKP